MTASQPLTPELRAWIIDQASAGVSADRVFKAMCDAGWNADVAESAMESVLTEHLAQLQASKDTAAAAASLPLPCPVPCPSPPGQSPSPSMSVTRGQVLLALRTSASSYSAICCRRGVRRHHRCGRSRACSAR
ncbi:hypothetical protein [Comamonas sp. JC664]|uniref:hypothetical protein n=1 Tax=Comamonas sp. JC664 TaxID=2801917 RepID=UPI0036242BF6